MRGGSRGAFKYLGSGVDLILGMGRKKEASCPQFDIVAGVYSKNPPNK